ncbi:spidroin-2-like [Bos indicus x Bos taurus]|uniref:spidroin-2-like n=1 Tax=Bos indicus x Bos taurus TaxID=30522 RepID=UPI000F7D51C1|nr:spidroin-2-like [Bos indicus x Bos taurus]
MGSSAKTRSTCPQLQAGCADRPGAGGCTHLAHKGSAHLRREEALAGPGASAGATMGNSSGTEAPNLPTTPGGLLPTSRCPRGSKVALASPAAARLPGQSLTSTVVPGAGRVLRGGRARGDTGTHTGARGPSARLRSGDEPPGRPGLAPGDRAPGGSACTARRTSPAGTKPGPPQALTPHSSKVRGRPRVGREERDAPSAKTRSLGPPNRSPGSPGPSHVTARPLQRLRSGGRVPGQWSTGAEGARPAGRPAAAATAPGRVRAPRGGSARGSGASRGGAKLGAGGGGGGGTRHREPPPPRPAPTAAFVSAPGPRPPSRPQPAPGPALPGGASKVAARASPRAPPPSRGVAGSRRRRRGGRGGGGGPGLRGGGAALLAAAAAAAGAGGAFNPEKRRSGRGAHQGSSGGWRGSAAAEDALLAAAAAAAAELERARRSPGREAAAAGEPEPPPPLPPSSMVGGEFTAPGAGRGHGGEAAAAAAAALGCNWDAKQAVAAAAAAALRADRPVPQPYSAPQSCPFVVSWWDPRCRAEEAGCSAVPRSEAPLLPAPERMGRKGLSCPSLGKGLRSFRSEVQPPAAVI